MARLYVAAQHYLAGDSEAVPFEPRIHRAEGRPDKGVPPLKSLPNRAPVGYSPSALPRWTGSQGALPPDTPAPGFSCPSTHDKGHSLSLIHI